MSSLTSSFHGGQYLSNFTSASSLKVAADIFHATADLC